MGNTVKFDARKPCTNCTVLTLDASLENADGSAAENKNGVCIIIRTQNYEILIIVEFRPGSITQSSSMPVLRRVRPAAAAFPSKT